MRIVSLVATKVGRWAPQTLRFGPGLTLVYGPNEAGKSTALRALEALLFPGEARATESFARLTAPLSPHQFDATLTLEREDGEGGVEQVSWRRKGKSLVDGSDRPVLPEVAHAWLWETSQTDFRTLYALGHDRLRDHQGLLGHDSALGRVLTEMASGGRNLSFYLEESQGELDKQYKPRGKNHHLNNALLVAEQAVKNVKKADEDRGHLAYRRACDDQQAATARREALEARLRESRRAVGDLDRLAFAPPLLEDLERKSARIAELRAEGPVPPSAACEALHRSREGFEERRREHEAAAQALVEAEAALRERVPSARVLDVEDRLERVVHLRAAFVSAPEQRERRVQDANERARVLRAALSQLGLPLDQDRDQATNAGSIAARTPTFTPAFTPAFTPTDEAPILGRWVPAPAVRASLSKSFQALADAEDAERVARDALETAQEHQRDQAAAVLRLSRSDESEARVLRALKAETDAGESPQAIATAREVWGDRHRALAIRAQKLGAPADGSLASWAVLRLPVDERLAEVRAAFDVAIKQARVAEAALVEARDRVRVCADREARRRESLPNTLDLPAARAARDEAWLVLREIDATAGGSNAEAQALARVRGLASFERAERVLDETVDGVLANANAVAELAELRRAHADALREQEARLAASADAERAVIETRALWTAAFVDADLPAPPIEQAGFLREARQFVADAEHLLAEETQLQRREMAAADLLTRLSTGLAAQQIVVPPEPSFRLLVSIVEERLATLQQAEGARRVAQDSLEKRERERERATTRYEAAKAHTVAARAELTRVVEAAALPASLAADGEQLKRWIADGKSLAEQLRALNEAVEAVATEEREHERRLGELRDVVQLLVDRGVALPSTDSTPLAQLDAIAQAVREARTTRSFEENREKAREMATRRARAFETWRLDYSRALSDAALDEAAYRFSLLDDRDPAATRLTSLLARAREVHRLELERDRLMADASRAAQLDFDKLVAQVAGRSQASIADEKAAAERAIASLEEERRAAHEAELSATQIVQAMEQGGDHDTLRQAHESALASLAEEMRATLAAKGATVVLAELTAALTAHDHRALLLQRASKFLSLLTLGSFEEVRTDEQDGVLVVRAGAGETLATSALSEGTRDQVYLALRLAVAEGTLETKRLPFLLDDVLVHFDDARAIATLRAFEDLARHTQVIVFTHHDHLVERAKAAGIGFEVIALDAPEIAPRDPSSSSANLSNVDSNEPVSPTPRRPRRPSLSVESARAASAAQLELLAPSLPEGSEEAFLAALRAAAPAGEKVSTSSLKKSLGFEDATFNAVRAVLLAANKVQQDGRSLRLVTDEPSGPSDDHDT